MSNDKWITDEDRLALLHDQPHLLLKTIGSLRAEVARLRDANHELRTRLAGHQDIAAFLPTDAEMEKDDGPSQN